VEKVELTLSPLFLNIALLYCQTKKTIIMGACDFQNKSRGTSMSEAYRSAVSEAREEYGNDSYNGTISTTSGFRDLTSEFKRSGLSLNKFIDENIDKAEKRGNCFGICIKEPKSNTNKIKSQVTNFVEKGTRKWVLKHIVYDRYQETEIASEDTKGEAIKKARAHTEKTQERTVVVMKKVLEKGSPRVAEITYKGSSNETLGEYIFFGIAAE